MLIVKNNNIVGNTAPNIYDGMKPWQHECGVYWWTCTNTDSTYELAALTDLAQLTQGELEATAEYIVWAQAQADAQAAQDAYDAAVTAWQSVPDFLKTYTDAQVDAWVDANIATIADMKSAFATSVKGMRKIVDLMKINYLS